MTSAGVTQWRHLINTYVNIIIDYKQFCCCSCSLNTDVQWKFTSYQMCCHTLWDVRSIVDAHCAAQNHTSYAVMSSVHVMNFSESEANPLLNFYANFVVHWVRILLEPRAWWSVRQCFPFQTIPRKQFTHGPTVDQPYFYRWASVGSQRWAIVDLLVGATLAQ